MVFGFYLAVVTNVYLRHFMEKSGLPIQEYKVSLSADLLAKGLVELLI